MIRFDSYLSRWIETPTNKPWRHFFLQAVPYLDPSPCLISPGSLAREMPSYGWWTKSCTTKDDDYPIVYRVLTIPGGAGFCPSTVLQYIRVTYRLVKRKTLAQDDFRSVVYNLKPNALSHTPMLLWNIYAHLASIYGKCGTYKCSIYGAFGICKRFDKKEGSAHQVLDRPSKFDLTVFFRVLMY